MNLFLTGREVNCLSLVRVGVTPVLSLSANPLVLV